MASTTTLKLSDELKSRIATVAQASGKSPHAFMVEELEAQARLAEMRQSFINDALTSATKVDAGGVLDAMEEVHAHILKRTSGKSVKRPQPIVQSESRIPNPRRRPRAGFRS